MSEAQTIYSGVVNALLELVGLEVGSVENLAKVAPATVVPEAPKQVAKGQEELANEELANEELAKEKLAKEKLAKEKLRQDLLKQKQDLVVAYEKTYSSSPRGATDEQDQPLIGLRFQFSRLAMHYDSDPTALAAAFDNLVKAHDGVQNDVLKMQKARETLVNRLNTALPKEDLPGVVKDALEEEAKPLAVARVRIETALCAALDAKAQKPAEMLGAAAADLEKLLVDLEALKQEVGARTEARVRLGVELAEVVGKAAKLAKDVAPGATEEDVKPLLDGRDQIARVLDDSRAKLAEINEQSDKIAALKLDRGKVIDAVAARQVRRQTIETEADSIVKGLPKDANPEDVRALGQTIEKALKAEPLTDTALNQAEETLERLREGAESERNYTKELSSRCEAYRKRVDELKELAKQTCKKSTTKGDEVYDDYDVVVKYFEQISKLLYGTLYEIDFDGTFQSSDDDEAGRSIDEHLRQARNQLDRLVMTQIAKNPKNRKGPPPTTYILGAATKVAAEGAQLLPFAKQSTHAVKELPGQLKSVETLLKEISQENEKQALVIVGRMRTTLDEAREEAGETFQKLSDLRDALLERVAQDSPPGLPVGYDKVLQDQSQQVKTALGEGMSPKITDEVIKKATGATDRFEADLALAQALGKLWPQDKALQTALAAARSPLQPDMQALRAAVLDEAKKGFGGCEMRAALPLATRLAALVKQAIHEVGKAAGAKDAIGKAATGSEALDQETTALLYDLVGPEAIAALGVKPAGLKTLCACFKKAGAEERQGLRDLVTEGFGGQGKVLAALVRSNDVDSILALASGYGGEGGKDDRARLRGLVEQGGLGEAPTVLDDMLGYGVAVAQDQRAQRGRNVTRLKSLGTEFGDTDGPARMKTLVADCGLGKPRPEDPPRPGVFAEMLYGDGVNGLGGDAKALRTFADGYSGTTPTDEKDRARLKGLIDEGGFGNRPKAFAPLVKRLIASGGDKGAAPKLKQIGTTFEAPQDRQQMNRLLERGGMSGDVGDQRQSGENREHEHPDTLAKVFTDGLGERADKLKGFVKAFGDSDSHAGECEQMMDAWNEFPDTHQGARQPGRKIAKLLSGRHFNGNVDKLQTQFTTNMKQVALGRRKLATRFAPGFDKNYAAQGTVEKANLGLVNQDVESVCMGYILGRHSPSHAKDGRKQSNNQEWLEAENSYFPVDSTEGDILGWIKEALDSDDAPALGASSEVTLANGMTVEIAMKDNGAVVHCFPSSGEAPPHPQEVAKFSKSEAERIFAAVRP
jgi:hypothetical protein